MKERGSCRLVNHLYLHGNIHKRRTLTKKGSAPSPAPVLRRSLLFLPQECPDTDNNFLVFSRDKVVRAKGT